MENLDVSYKLRGFNTLYIHKQIDKYLEMIGSEDTESVFLGIGLMHDDTQVMNYFDVLLQNRGISEFRWHLNKIIDPDTSYNARMVYSMRIYLTLQRIRRGFNNFRYMIYESK